MERPIVQPYYQVVMCNLKHPLTTSQTERCDNSWQRGVIQVMELPQHPNRQKKKSFMIGLMAPCQKPFNRKSTLTSHINVRGA